MDADKYADLYADLYAQISKAAWRTPALLRVLKTAFRACWQAASEHPLPSFRRAWARKSGGVDARWALRPAQHRGAVVLHQGCKVCRNTALGKVRQSGGAH